MAAPFVPTSIQARNPHSKSFIELVQFSLLEFMCRTGAVFITRTHSPNRSNFQPATAAIKIRREFLPTDGNLPSLDKSFLPGVLFDTHVFFMGKFPLFLIRIITLSASVTKF